MHADLGEVGAFWKDKTKQTTAQIYQAHFCLQWRQMAASGQPTVPSFGLSEALHPHLAEAETPSHLVLFCDASWKHLCCLSVYGYRFLKMKIVMATTAAAYYRAVEVTQVFVGKSMLSE